ncbi:MAG: hypothetical protein ACKN9F_11590 [Methylomonas sp.]
MQDPQYGEHRRRFQIEEALLIILLGLALLGISVTEFSPSDGYAYWLGIVFVFAVMAVLISWFKSKKTDLDFGAIVKEQALHWLTTLMVVGGAFLLQQSGRLDETSASLVVLLILALATMLDGIRIGWQLSLVGFFLGACAVLIAYLEQFMLVAGLLAIVIIACTIVWEIWTHKRAYR